MRLAKFVPQPDITPFEIAQVLQVLIAGNNHDINNPTMKFPGETNSQFDTFVENYPDLQRHFEITEHKIERVQPIDFGDDPWSGW